MRGIQLSYNTLNDIVNDKNLTKGMVVYAASKNTLGDGGGSYYEIIEDNDINGTDTVYKLNNSLYAKVIETTPYKEKLENISLLIDNAESTLETIKEIVNAVEQLEENITKEIEDATSSISDGLTEKVNTTDSDLDNVSYVIGELCDECLTLYSEALQLKGTSMGDMSLIKLVPILDSDIDNLARHIGFHEDSLNILAEQIGRLMDYDYIVKNRIKDLEDAMKVVKPDFTPEPYPSGKDPAGDDNTDDGGNENA